MLSKFLRFLKLPELPSLQHIIKDSAQRTIKKTTAFKKYKIIQYKLKSGSSNTIDKRLFSLSSGLQHWRNQNDKHQERRKTIPKLVYLHNPWKYLITKINLWKLHIFWDRQFSEKEFIRGSKQAAIVMTDIIRDQDAGKISQFTTPIGFQQITRDMILSRNDTRLQLIKFNTEHLRRAIPMKVLTRSKYGRRHCFIDMLFVGLRNTKDFDSNEELVKVNEIIRRMDVEMKTPRDIATVPHRIVFAEIFMRFRKDYSTPSQAEDAIDNGSKDWSVSFYKILSFDVINYDPR